MRQALANLLDRYVGLVNCGDCGFWNPETEPEVIAARAALARPARQPIETAPRDGTFIMLWAPSGYHAIPWRCEVGSYYAEYRLAPWRTHSGDSFEEGGEAPTHWSPLPDDGSLTVTRFLEGTAVVEQREAAA